MPGSGGGRWCRGPRALHRGAALRGPRPPGPGGRGLRPLWAQLRRLPRGQAGRALRERGAAPPEGQRGDRKGGGRAERFNGGPEVRRPSFESRETAQPAREEAPRSTPSLGAPPFPPRQAVMLAPGGPFCTVNHSAAAAKFINSPMEVTTCFNSISTKHSHDVPILLSAKIL